MTDSIEVFHEGYRLTLDAREWRRVSETEFLHRRDRSRIELVPRSPGVKPWVYTDPLGLRKQEIAWEARHKEVE